MAWIIIIGLITLCYVLFKFTIAILADRDIVVTETKKYFLGWLIAIAVFVPYCIYEEKTKIEDGGIYYVNLFTKEDSAKNYRVPGLINIDDYGFHLYEIYWPNGGMLSFDYGSHYTDLIVGKKVLAKDNTGKDWFVELTRDKAR